MSQLIDHNNSFLIIGIGNELCGDDAIGIEVVRSLEKKLAGKAEFYTEQHDLTNLLDIWKAKNVILIDCIYDSESGPGEIFVFSSLEELVRFKVRSFSTHGIGLNEVCQLARLLNKLPHKLTVYGISGSRFDIGASPEKKVKKAGKKVGKSLVKNLFEPAHTF